MPNRDEGTSPCHTGNDSLFSELAETLGHPESAKDHRFAANPARCENALILKRLIETETLQHRKLVWIERFEAAGIPTGPIQNVAEVLSDPQIIARYMVVSVGDSKVETTFAAAGNPIKMSGMPDVTPRLILTATARASWPG